jgi:glycosyltransferase involved in cell wall biosynthesis
MSRVLFECLASGCALVASRVGVVPEILVDEEHALLVPAGDAAALAAAIRRVIDDPALAAAIASRAYQRVCADYRLETNVDALADLLAGVGRDTAGERMLV